MRTNIYKPINRTRVMAAFFNGSTTEAVAIREWLEGPLTAPYVPPTVSTRDITSFTLDRWTPDPVGQGDVVVRNIETGLVKVVPRENFFEQYTYADHINVNYVNLKGEKTDGENP